MMKNWIWQNTGQPLNWQQRFGNRKTMFLFSYGLPLEDNSEQKKENEKNTISGEDQKD